jgi:hypothetical protein
MFDSSITKQHLPNTTKTRLQSHPSVFVGDLFQFLRIGERWGKVSASHLSLSIDMQGACFSPLSLYARCVLLASLSLCKVRASRLSLFTDRERGAHASLLSLVGTYQPV